MSCGEEVKHGWSAETLEDLMDKAQEQYESLQKVDFSTLLSQREEELECWHAAAVAHLGQIYSQRLADLHQVYNEDVQPESDKFKTKMIEQLNNRVLPRIAKVLDDPTPDPQQVERMQNVLSHLKNECSLMLDRQWIRIQLPEMKNLSIPIKISGVPPKINCLERGKDLLGELNDQPTRDLLELTKKRKSLSLDLVDLFLSNPDPMKTYPLDTNTSTLSLSNGHILLHDHQRLILFDYQKKLSEYPWSDNELGILVDICWMSSLSSFLLLTIHSVYLYDPSKSSSSSSASPPLKIDSIHPVERTHVFASICCLDRDIYINYHKGVHLDHYRVSSTNQWTLEKRFSKSSCCEAKDIGIRDVRCDGESLSLSIMQQEELKWRVDLLSKDLTRIRRGTPMDSGENQHKFFSMLIPLFDRRWLFLNWFTNKLWIVDEQGTSKLIKDTKVKNVRNASVSPNRSFIALRTEKPSTLKLYKLD